MALMVGVVEYFSKSLRLKKRGYYNKIVSFSAGISITYILLELLPTFTEAAFAINKFLFLTLLFGFISHHVAEKEIYKHTKSHELVKLLSLEESIFYYVYHLILGFIFILFIQQNLVNGTFFFVSIIAYTLASNLPTTPHKSKGRMILFSSSTFIGAVIASLIPWTVPLWFEFALVGLVTGVLLFTVTRHHIPYGRKGKIMYFVLGFTIYTIFIISKWV